MAKDGKKVITIARREDWRTEPMPEQRETFVLERSFSEKEMNALRCGNVPKEMEDKWFWFMEGSTLFAHRSWTGTCIYRIDFQEDDRHIVTVNRNPAQYNCTDIEEDIESLNRLLDWWTEPCYDHYNEWLSETYDALKKAGKTGKEEPNAPVSGETEPLRDNKNRNKGAAMKIAIRYFTKSKKGNTKKLADAVSAAIGVKALDVSSDLTEKTDVVFLINAMYAANIDREVIHFLERNKDNIGEIVNMNTAASGASTWNAVKKAADPLGISVSEKEFHCAASWIFINKGLPTEEDFKKAGEFAAKIVEEA